MQDYKIIFAGQTEAGKSIAIATLSEIGVARREDLRNADWFATKLEMATMGISYGQVVLPPDLKLSLYGTPDQERFRSAGQNATVGAIGVVIIIDSSGARPLEDVSHYIDFFALLGIVNIVVGLTRMGEGNVRNMDEFHAHLADKKCPYPVFSVDVRSQSDVLLLVETVVAFVEVKALVLRDRLKRLQAERIPFLDN